MSLPILASEIASLSTVRPKVQPLYFKGNFQKELFANCLAVVGSRRMTFYGERVVEKIIPPLVQAGITIVSGFMYGVDQKAHQVCLDCGGKTIAVLGWGIDWLVPEFDQSLYQRIAKNGLILSEYEGDLKPQLWMFPRRNRIVAGLSQAVLVVEAAEGSGSLITASFAAKFRRKLFAVPGPITSKISLGTNQLIKSGKAVMATSAEDILPEFKFKFLGETRTEAKDPILALLENESLSVDEIAVKIKKPVEAVGMQLSLLQLKGQVIETDGKYYCSNK